MKIVHFGIYLNDLLIGQFHLLQYEDTIYDIANRISWSFIENDYLNENTYSVKLPERERLQINLRSAYENCHVSEKKVVATNKSERQYSESNESANKRVMLQYIQTLNDCECLGLLNNVVKRITINTSEEFLVVFYKTLFNSQSYRNYVLNSIFKLKKSIWPEGNIYSYVNLLITSFGNVNVIDYKWNEILQKLCMEKRELNRAMSWLSTLGGACSALGDENKYFASEAGRISVEQFRLAIKLGDELTVCRCKLYYALSLIQRGEFRTANKIISEQYNFAKNNKITDNKLISMCLGINTKLQYEYNKSKSKKLRHRRLRY